MASYRSFFEKLVETSKIRLCLVAPQRFTELGGQDIACQDFSAPFGGQTHPVAVLKTFNLHTQAVIFIGLIKVLRGFFRDLGRLNAAPEEEERKIFVCLAEPYSVTAFFAWLGGRIALGEHFEFVCYTAQNIHKKFAWPMNLIQKIIFKHSRAILAVGEEQRQVLRGQGYRGAIVDFPLWFDERRFHLGKRVSDEGHSPKLRVGFAGSLTYAKGVDLLVRACEYLPQLRLEGIEIHIAGKGEPQFEANLREALKRLSDKGTAVHFRGSVDSSSMAEFFGGLDVLVVPSRTMPHWKEQFGRVIIEAQACGVVVLGSTSGEIPRVVGNPLCIFQEDDAKSLGECLERNLKILDKPVEGQEMQKNTAEYALQRYSDRVLARRFAAVFENHWEQM